MIDELEQRLAAIIGSDAAHLIRRMIDARELIGTAWEEDAPSPIIDELRQTAGNLVNGVIEDGEVPVNMLTEAADEIERLRGDAQAKQEPVEVRCPHCESWFEPVVTSPLSSTTRATPILT